MTWLSTLVATREHKFTVSLYGPCSRTVLTDREHGSSESRLTALNRQYMTRRACLQSAVGVLHAVAHNVVATTAERANFVTLGERATARHEGEKPGER